ncbi:MAG TPA: double-strand break repair protein AddB [Beijerinckiaceae bacterium]|jgi:ATP-dependent helicase/nuclease subunit B
MAIRRVATIPPGCPFLPTLVDAIDGGRLIDGLSLDSPAWGEAVIYLPTQRAARALGQLLAERRGGRAQLLPRIVPLGEADEAEFELAEGGEGRAFEEAEVLAPPIAPLERRLILTRLVQRWSAEVDRDLLRLGPGIPFMVPSSPADAVALAADLERLMDSLATEGLAWDEIASAVEADYSRYFEITLRFVRIAAENWPKILASRGTSDPAQRRNALLAAEARRLRRERPTTPVIAAGSTGSIPATAGLLAAIAELPAGCVVLPGLDTGLDEASWTAVGGERARGVDPVHGHPQALLHRLTGPAYLGTKRAAVIRLGTPGEGAAARERLLSEALRPADTTDAWAALDPAERQAVARAGCAGLAVVEAADERDEALCAAIALREAVETPGRTAALVTPDRALAARVAAELCRWGLDVEDSAGTALADTRAGRLARLAVDAAALDFPPVRLLALLAHPDLRLGFDRPTLERAASALEIGVLRGPAPAPGLEPLRATLDLRRAEVDRRSPRAVQRLAAEDWDLAATLIDRLDEAFAGFSNLVFPDDLDDLVVIAESHRLTLEALRVGEETEELERPDERALAALFDDLRLIDAGGVAGRFVDYQAFFTALARQRVVAPAPRGTHRRVKILGLLEARLLDVDRVVLGGLDETVWPPRTETDAFLNRPMRLQIGLAPPERRIGQTAHDFVQALGAPEAIVTRAQKRDGSPMVPSRFLQRLKAFVGDEEWRGLTRRGDVYRRLAQVLDTPEAAAPLPRPAPKPEPRHFPRTLSVTEIETLVRDPYSIFARHILKLDALEPVAGSPTAADRGTLIHDILGSFAADHPDALPAHAELDVLQRGADAFAPIKAAYPEVFAEWWPRFERLATAFVRFERKRRDDIKTIYPERSGSLPILLGDGSTFTLRARADRIEARRDGGAVIIDFKTGAPPGKAEVFAGFSPQLTLEAAMLQRGAFKGLPKTEGVPELLYVHTSGGRKPLELKPVEPPRGEERSVAEIVEEHYESLVRLLDRYASGEAGYLSRPFPKFARRFSDYDHLARVKEWSLASAGGGEAGSA